jgi:hypothetical protein
MAEEHAIRKVQWLPSFQAFCDLAKNGPLPLSTEVIFVGLVDEEFGQAGSRKLAKSGPQADLAIAGEPTELKVVTAHKGNSWLQLKTTGVAAHGATPQNGKNAIEAMTPILKTLFHDYPKILSKRTHPLLGSPTLILEKFRGATNPILSLINASLIWIDERSPERMRIQSKKNSWLYSGSKNYPPPISRALVLYHAHPWIQIQIFPSFKLCYGRPKKEKLMGYPTLRMPLQSQWVELRQLFLVQVILHKHMQGMNL